MTRRENKYHRRKKRRKFIHYLHAHPFHTIRAEEWETPGYTKIVMPAQITSVSDMETRRAHREVLAFTFPDPRLIIPGPPPTHVELDENAIHFLTNKIKNQK